MKYWIDVDSWQLRARWSRNWSQRQNRAGQVGMEGHLPQVKSLMGWQHLRLLKRKREELEQKGAHLQHLDHICIPQQSTWNLVQKHCGGNSSVVTATSMCRQLASFLWNLLIATSLHLSEPELLNKPLNAMTSTMRSLSQKLATSAPILAPNIQTNMQAGLVVPRSHQLIPLTTATQQQAQNWWRSFLKMGNSTQSSIPWRRASWSILLLDWLKRTYHSQQANPTVFNNYSSILMDFSAAVWYHCLKCTHEDLYWAAWQGSAWIVGEFYG